ncbi:MAG TPA: CheR family methyltransferase [Syntrophales bacterium]|nr:CheR family methyltransferase [Syntrophales bacterium]
MDDNSFRKLLERLGLSWKGYVRVRKVVKKRIVRHMQELGVEDIDYYLQALEHPMILREAERLMAVSISSFFRDNDLWQELEGEILPGIAARHPEEIHAWSAGCAMGQEAYSLAVLWDMLKKNLGSPPSLLIWATDINPDYLKKATAGVYGKSSLRRMLEEIRKTYFPKCEDGLNFCVSGSLKENILWKVHDLIKEEPPRERFQIIFLRNSVFTYYREDLQALAFRKALTCLDEGGLFIVGKREKPPENISLAPFHGSSYIFQKA